MSACPKSEKCERLLKADCPEKPELLCDKCTEKKGGRSHSCHRYAKPVVVD